MPTTHKASQFLLRTLAIIAIISLSIPATTFAVTSKNGTTQANSAANKSGNPANSPVNGGNPTNQTPNSVGGGSNNTGGGKSTGGGIKTTTSGGGGGGGQGSNNTGGGLSPAEKRSPGNGGNGGDQGSSGDQGSGNGGSDSSGQGNGGGGKSFLTQMTQFVSTVIKETKTLTVEGIRTLIDSAKKAAGIDTKIGNDFGSFPSTPGKPTLKSPDDVRRELAQKTPTAAKVPDSIVKQREKDKNGGFTDAQMKKYDEMNREEAKRKFNIDLAMRRAGVEVVVPGGRGGGDRPNSVGSCHDCLKPMTDEQRDAQDKKDAEEKRIESYYDEIPAVNAAYIERTYNIPAKEADDNLRAAEAKKDGIKNVIELRDKGFTEPSHFRHLSDGDMYDVSITELEKRIADIDKQIPQLTEKKVAADKKLDTITYVRPAAKKPSAGDFILNIGFPAPIDKKPDVLVLFDDPNIVTPETAKKLYEAKIASNEADKNKRNLNSVNLSYLPITAQEKIDAQTKKEQSEQNLKSAKVQYDNEASKELVRRSNENADAREAESLQANKQMVEAQTGKDLRAMKEAEKAMDDTKKRADEARDIADEYKKLDAEGTLIPTIAAKRASYDENLKTFADLSLSRDEMAENTRMAKSYYDFLNAGDARRPDEKNPDDTDDPLESWKNRLSNLPKTETAPNQIVPIIKPLQQSPPENPYDYLFDGYKEESDIREATKGWTKEEFAKNKEYIKKLNQSTVETKQKIEGIEVDLRKQAGVVIEPDVKFDGVSPLTIAQVAEAQRIIGRGIKITAGFALKGHAPDSAHKINGQGAIDLVVDVKDLSDKEAREKTEEAFKVLSALGIKNLGVYNEKGKLHADNSIRSFAIKSEEYRWGWDSTVSRWQATGWRKDLIESHIEGKFDGYKDIKPIEINENSITTQRNEDPKTKNLVSILSKIEDERFSSKPPVPDQQTSFLGNVYKTLADKVSQKAKDAKDSLEKNAPAIAEGIKKWNSLPQWMQGLAKIFFSTSDRKLLEQDLGDNTDNTLSIPRATTTSEFGGY